MGSWRHGGGLNEKDAKWERSEGRGGWGTFLYKIFNLDD